MERLSFGHGFVPRIGRQNHRALDRALAPPSLFGDERTWEVRKYAALDHRPEGPLALDAVDAFVELTTWHIRRGRTSQVLSALGAHPYSS